MANGQLWTGLHPDALGLLYDDTAAVGVYQGSSVITGPMIDALTAGLLAAEVEAAVLPGLQQAHWAIHRAFCDYQAPSEDRRHLAADRRSWTRDVRAEIPSRDAGPGPAASHRRCP